MELEKIKRFIQQASDLHLSGCKVNYDYSLLTAATAESYKLTLFGMSVFPNLQVNKDQLADLGHFFLQIRRFNLEFNSKIWDEHPGKFLVIGFIEELTEDAMNVLRIWDCCENPKFCFFLIVFKKGVILPKFEKIVVKKGKKSVKENFNVGDLPWFSVVYDSFEVFSGRLEKFYLPAWENLSKKYSVVETLSFFHDYNQIVLYHSIKKKEKIIDLSGVVVLDFFDESCQDSYLQEDDFGKKIKYYKVYAGVEAQHFRYSLESRGLEHPTAEKLFLIDCPTSFIFCNQKLLWRGNRFYENFKALVFSYVEGSEYSPDSSSEEVFLHSFNKIKENLFEDDINLLVDVKIDVLVYLSSWEILEKKFRSRLVVCLENEDDKAKAEELHEKLKSVLPNLQFEVTERQNLFATGLEPTVTVPSKTRKKGEKKLKIEKLNQLIEKLKSEASYQENQIKEKNNLIEKQLFIIHHLKSSNLGKLHKRIDKIIEERTKSELEIESKNKQIRELTHKLSNFKSQLEQTDSLGEKRDSQLSSLVSKLRTQEQEISRLTQETSKKSKNLLVLQGELTELRPSREAQSTVDKQTKIIEELKKQLNSKDNEIAILKDIIKASHYFTPESSVNSPGKLPKIGQNRSGSFAYKSKFKSNYVSKSIDHRNIAREDIYEVLEQEDNEKKRLMELEQERIRQEEIERLAAIEQERKIKEKEAEDREQTCMAFEENLSKEFYKILRKKEEDEKAEKLKKIQEEQKKQKTAPKTKPGAKPTPKPTNKKK